MTAPPAGLLEDLARPEAYPAPRPTTVKLVTTHISWVFITDREVWKLKRPVDYGFVNYTTVDRRRRFCHEEVRVNCRLAPDVYLGVVPVRLEGGHYSFASTGTVVDYAVRMRRLPDSASAEGLLRHGALTHEHLHSLASRLAAFYATSPPGSSWGSLDVLRANVDENFVQVRPFVGRVVDAATFEAVWRWQVGSLASNRRLFAARQEQERIRDGHGDLRLEHVYFERDQPIVIDAIEFNERFRIGDVAADVAFLAMELDARSKPDLAASFLAAFARESGDDDLYSVVDFYLSYRAWVRGKVATFLAADPSVEPEKARRKSREAERLFALARAYSGPRRGLEPVVAVGGVIGAGKSTLADALGRSLGLPVIDSDRTRKALAGVLATQQAPADAYTAAFTRRTYDELFRRANVVLGTGRGVILDASFRDRHLRRRAGTSRARTGVPFASWKQSATIQHFARVCVLVRLVSPCPTRPRICLTGSAASLNPSPSSQPVSTCQSSPHRPCRCRSPPSATRWRTESGPGGSISLHDQDGDSSVRESAFGHAPEQQSRETSGAAGSDRDDIGASR